MTAAFKKIKIYTKLIGIGLIFLLVLLFIVSNREEVSVNFIIWKTPPVPMFVFIIAVANLGIVFFLVSRKVRKVIRDFRQLKREERQRRQSTPPLKKEVLPKETDL